MHACSLLRVLARLAVLWAVGVVLAAALLVVLVDTAVVAVDGGPVSVSDLVDTSLPAIRVLALTGMPISGGSWQRRLARRLPSFFLCSVYYST